MLMNIFLSLVMRVAEYFRLALAEARSIEFHVPGAVKQWEKRAKETVISHSETEIMLPAFRI